MKNKSSYLELKKKFMEEEKLNEMLLELEKEYQEKEDFLETLSEKELQVYLDHVKDEIEYLKYDTLDQMKIVSRNYAGKKLLVKISRFFGDDMGVDFEGEELNLLDKRLDTCLEFLSYESKLNSLLGVAPLNELLRLSQMIERHCVLNCNYWSMQADMNAYASRGFFYSYLNEDTINSEDAFRVFFSKKISEFKGKKVVIKNYNLKK